MSQEQCSLVFCNFLVCCFHHGKIGFCKNTIEKAHRSQLLVGDCMGFMGIYGLVVWDLKASRHSQSLQCFHFFRICVSDEIVFVQFPIVFLSHFHMNSLRILTLSLLSFSLANSRPFSAF